MIYFNLDEDTIKENCKFKFYYNKTDITPTVLDGGKEIILLIGQMRSILYATLTVTYQSEYPVIHIFW